MNLRSKTKRLAIEIRSILKTSNPIFFDHLPKCGGSTVNSYLWRNYPRRLVFQLDGAHPQQSIGEFKTLSQIQRYKYLLVTGHGAHQIKDYVNPEAYKVTVLREPVDRLVSHYYYVKRLKSHYLHEQLMGENISLAEYASKGISTELTNFYTSHYSGMSSEDVLKDPPKAISMALKILTETYDLIGFQDDIEGFLGEIKAACSLPESVPLKRKNVTENRKLVDDLSEEEYESIAISNAVDIELYELVRRTVAER